MDNVQAMAVIIGIVNGVRLLKAKDVWGFIFFMCAVIMGIILGFSGMFGLSPQAGFLVGLASSGLYRGLEKVGGQ